MRIRTRLLLTNLGVAALVGVTTLGAWCAVRGFQREFEGFAARTLPSLQALEKLRFAGLRIVTSTTESVLLTVDRPRGTDPSGAAHDGQEVAEAALIAEGRRQYQDALREASALAEVRFPEGRRFLDRIRGAGARLIATSDALIETREHGAVDVSLRAQKLRFEQAERSFLVEVGRLINLEQQVLAQERAALDRQVRRWALWGLLAGFVVFAVAVELALRLARSISTQLGALCRAAVRIGKGDRRLAIPSEGGEEFAALATALEHMVHDLDATTVSRDVAQAACQSKAELLARMSHEIRTPLHGILAFARFGQTACGKRSLDQVSEHFERIHECGERAVHLVEDLLALARLEAGKAMPRLVPSDLGEIVASVVGELEALCLEAGVPISVQGDVGDQVPVDRVMIMQVVRNLLGNALRFAPRHSVISVEIERAGEQARITVADRGPGIPPEDRDAIFDRFAQVGPRRGDPDEVGAGLGLSICREIVSLHQGRIWAEGKPGPGARLIFELPLDGPACEPVAVDEDSAAPSEEAAPPVLTPE